MAAIGITLLDLNIQCLRKIFGYFENIDIVSVAEAFNITDKNVNELAKTDDNTEQLIKSKFLRFATTLQEQFTKTYGSSIYVELDRFKLHRGVIRHFGGLITELDVNFMAWTVVYGQYFEPLFHNAVEMFAEINSLPSLRITLEHSKYLPFLPLSINGLKRLSLHFTHNCDFNDIAECVKLNSGITHLTIEKYHFESDEIIRRLNNLIDILPYLEIFEIECRWQDEDMIKDFIKMLSCCTRNIQFVAFWSKPYKIHHQKFLRTISKYAGDSTFDTIGVRHRWNIQFSEKKIPGKIQCDEFILVSFKKQSTK